MENYHNILMLYTNNNTKSWEENVGEYSSIVNAVQQIKVYSNEKAFRCICICIFKRLGHDIEFKYLEKNNEFL